MLRFSGITERDADGALSGNVDPDDWNQKDNWDPTDMSYFPELDTLNLNNEGITNETEGSNWLAYPNPTSGEVYLEAAQLNKFNPELEFGILKIIDADGTVKLELDITNFSLHHESKFIFGLSTGGLFESGIHRVYYLYKFKDQDYIFKGHGDIALE